MRASRPTSSEPNKVFYSQKSGRWENLNSVNELQPLIDSPPEELSACDAINWQDGRLGVDLRPFLQDANKRLSLVDSGSQVTAYPPEPGDQPDPNLALRAVNGTRLRCYGYKDVEIQIGWKK